MARKGTEYIYNHSQMSFQKIAKNNVIEWDQCKELLFDFKKMIDQCYRNMMWHFSHGEGCMKCKYWDEVYSKHLARVNVPTELTDQEMLDAVTEMEVDGSN